MHFIHLALAAARVLRGADILQAAAITATGERDPLTRPHLGIYVEAASSTHPKLHTGELVIEYRFDADDTDSSSPADHAAAADLHAAVSHLISAAGRAALQERLGPESIWLRVLGSPAPFTTVSDGERSFTHQVRIPFWIQTSF